MTDELKDLLTKLNFSDSKKEKVVFDNKENLEQDSNKA